VIIKTLNPNPLSFAQTEKIPPWVRNIYTYFIKTAWIRALLNILHRVQAQAEPASRFEVFNLALEYYPWRDIYTPHIMTWAVNTHTTANPFRNIGAPNPNTISFTKVLQNIRMRGIYLNLKVL
jgi:hypothetical protein